MSRTAVVAVDQGTTNTKAVLFSTDGSLLSQRSRSVAVSHPRPGWTEQSASQIWDTVQAVLAEICGDAAEYDVVALGISNQRETVVLWDRATGVPVAPAILWQCRRTSELCGELRARGAAPLVLERTGLVLDPLFPSTKIRWLLDSDPSLRSRANRGEILGGTVDSWLLWKLTGGRVHATDRSNASRTQLFNLDRLEWDSDLLALFDIPACLLPKVTASDDRFGQVAPGVTALAETIPISAMVGDSHAALFGHGVRSPGRAKVTCGTGSSIMALTPRRIASTHGLSSTIAWSRGDRTSYALEGNISVSGQAAAFATQLFGWSDEGMLTELAASVEDSDGAVFVPALAGLGAPHWDDQARGLICGMSLRTRPPHVARAVLEGIAHQICDVFEAMEADLGERMDGLSVDGGASNNDFLMQLLADLLGRRVVRPAITVVSALGAAAMAGESVGQWAAPLVREEDEFEGRIEATKRAELRESWREAVARARLRDCP